MQNKRRDTSSMFPIPDIITVNTYLAALLPEDALRFYHFFYQSPLSTYLRPNTETVNVILRKVTRKQPSSKW